MTKEKQLESLKRQLAVAQAQQRKLEEEFGEEFRKEDIRVNALHEEYFKALEEADRAHYNYYQVVYPRINKRYSTKASLKKLHKLIREKLNGRFPRADMETLVEEQLHYRVTAHPEVEKAALRRSEAEILKHKTGAAHQEATRIGSYYDDLTTRFSNARYDINCIITAIQLLEGTKPQTSLEDTDAARKVLDDIEW